MGVPRPNRERSQHLSLAHLQQNAKVVVLFHDPKTPGTAVVLQVDQIVSLMGEVLQESVKPAMVDSLGTW